MTKLIRGSADQVTVNIIKLLHCDSFDKDMVRYKLKSVTLCSELLPENSSKILENEGVLKKKVRAKERGSAC